MKSGHKLENEHINRNRTSLRQDVTRFQPVKNFHNRRIKS
jgi:hypothetical protein